MIHFSSLNLCPPIADAVAQRGYDTPTPIQAKAIPPILEGSDLLGCAQTGTGKTAAFALPMLHRLFTASQSRKRSGQRGPRPARALVLSPTRELASQIADSFNAYGANTGLSHTVIFGGVSQHHQVRSLRRGTDIIVATPGRLMDLMDQGHVDLRDIEIFALDEADRMLDMGFIQPIRDIASEIPEDRQTLLFSATMPKSIRHLANSLLTDPVHITVDPVSSTTDLIDQSLYMIHRDDKRPLLEHLLSDTSVERALVFTKTKYGADKLAKALNQTGQRAASIHGNKTQAQRERALQSFRAGRSRVLVATDVAARGLDVDGITHVFNFELPNEPEAYVHRIGRTGRAGMAGVAVSFCDRSERGFLRAIERVTGNRIPPTPAPEPEDLIRPERVEGRTHEPVKDRPEPNRSQRAGRRGDRPVRSDQSKRSQSRGSGSKNRVGWDNDRTEQAETRPAPKRKTKVKARKPKAKGKHPFAGELKVDPKSKGKPKPKAHKKKNKSNAKPKAQDTGSGRGGAGNPSAARKRKSNASRPAHRGQGTKS